MKLSSSYVRGLLTERWERTRRESRCVRSRLQHRPEAGWDLWEASTRGHPPSQHSTPALSSLHSGKEHEPDQSPTSECWREKKETFAFQIGAVRAEIQWPNRPLCSHGALRAPCPSLGLRLAEGQTTQCKGRGAAPSSIGETLRSGGACEGRPSF